MSFSDLNYQNCFFGGADADDDDDDDDDNNNNNNKKPASQPVPLLPRRDIP